MRRFAWLALGACCATTTPALAQRASLPTPQQLENRDTFTVGIGGAIIPDYEGSDDYRIIPGAAIRARISGISITTNGPYVYVDVVPKSGKFSFDGGPIAGLRFDSRRHSDDPVVSLLPKRNTAIELGGFAGVSIRGVTNPYDTVALHLDVLHDVGNAHKSTLFSPNVSFSTPVSRKTYVSLSAALDFAGDRYADYYFGITPQDSLLTGGILPVSSPNGGLKDWKTSLLVNQSITGDLLGGLSIFGLGQYSHLQGDFKASPIVSQRGSAGQWLGALGLAYTW
jgi:outer membrane scaffolding protein for murein synthesis (MipA/OmpV family)